MPPVVHARRQGPIALLLALVASTTPIHANGRFPAARMLANGPGFGRDTLALATTFGIAVSTDGGHTWGYTCEPALGFSATWDPPVAVAHDGAVLAGLPLRIARGERPYCTFDSPATAPATEVLDLAVDALGDAVAAAIAPAGQPQGVWLSSDRGLTWRAGFTQANFFIATVDIAPGHPQRLYVSGYQAGVGSVLMRSDDSGGTFVRTAADLTTGSGAYVAWVAPDAPDTVFVRLALPDSGTQLLRSDDAGETFRLLVQTRHEMTGAAFAPDGHAMWVGTSDVNEGILRSDDGGTSWQPVQCGFNTLCLRYAGDTLFACADNQLNGFAVAASTDDGAHFAPVLSLSRLGGPERCASGTGTADQCIATWPAVHQTISTDDGSVTSIGSTCVGDGGTMDAAQPDAATLDSAADSHADVGSDLGADASPTVHEGCGCRAPARPGGRSTLAWFAWATIASLRRRTRSAR